MSLSHLDRPQIIALLLVFSLVINAIVHFTHPAYKYYKERLEDLTSTLDSRYNDFERNIVTNIVPAIMFVSSNNVETIQRFVSDFGSPYNNSSQTEKEKSTERKKIIGHVFVVGDTQGFYSDDIPYYVGDDYQGGIVLRIGKSSVVTTDGLFLIERPKKILDNSSNEKELNNV